MRILEIKKRRKSLYAISLEPKPDSEDLFFETDSTGLLVLDASLVAEKGLSVNQEITNEDLVNLVSESFLRRAKSRALWYLSRGDLSYKELFGKLCRAFPEEAAKNACDKMQELGFINDERYAERLAENLLTGKRVSKRQAEYLMAGKGIDRETARYALDEVDADPVVIITELIEKKYKNKMGDKASTEKVIAALARRGFSFSSIREAVKKYNSEIEIYED